jgi:hypothetical protein
MISKCVLFSGLCLATLFFPQALKSQTHLAIQSLVVNPYTNAAEFDLALKSKDLDWKPVGNGESKADLTLIAASVDKGGNVLVGRRQSLTVTADTEDAEKLATTTTLLSAKVKIPIKMNSVRFLIQANNREIGAFEVDRKTIYAAPQSPPLTKGGHSSSHAR